MDNQKKGQVNISSVVDGATSAFVTLAIGGIVVGVVLFNIGPDIVTDGEVNDSYYTANESDSSLVNSLQGDVEDGMVQLASLVILLVVIIVLGFLRTRT